MNTPWCVKITCLPQGIKAEDLANRLGLPPNDVEIPKTHVANYYAWVNGFSDELSANKFAQNWNNVKIHFSTIKCKAVPTKSNVLLRRPPPVPGPSYIRSSSSHHSERLAMHRTNRIPGENEIYRCK